MSLKRSGEDHGIGPRNVRLGQRKLRVLVLDIGGSHIKVAVSGRTKPREIPSGHHLTPREFVRKVCETTSNWNYDVICIGYPGRVVAGRPVEDPPNLGRGWKRFDFQRAFRCPVKLQNDAALQALGSYRGGIMLFLGLGAGLGSTFIFQGQIHPMELGDLPYREGKCYADLIGKAMLKKHGLKWWRRHVQTAIRQLKDALQPDYVVLGGGEAQFAGKLPRGVCRGDNSKAFLGGLRMWQKNPSGQPPRRHPLAKDRNKGTGFRAAPEADWAHDSIL
jgi:polyphosphate glucokinase